MVIRRKEVPVVEPVVVPSDELLDDEAVVEGEKRGLPAEVSRSILGARPYMIAALAAITFVAVLAIGFVLGLNGSRMLVNSASLAGSGGNGQVVGSGSAYVDGSQYLKGYQNGFYDGLNYRRNEVMPYPMPYGGVLPQQFGNSGAGSSTPQAQNGGTGSGSGGSVGGAPQVGSVVPGN